MSALPEGLSGPSAQTYGRWEAILAERLVPLPDQPAESVRTTLAALWHRAAGREFSSRAAAGTALEPLDAQGEARLAALIERRLQGTPLAHITGRQHFMGLEMLASAEALIPREETELLGRAALEALRAAAEDRGEARAIDLCTGSGNVALALAWHEPRAHVWGADLSAEAIAFAGTNARHLGLHDRVTLLTGDLLEPFEPAAFDGTIDVVACNPPYISSARVEALAGEIRNHEPRLAFDGGPLGIRILARLIDEAQRVLRPGGVLAFEVGLGQGPGVRRRLERAEAWSGVEEIADPAGHTRVLVARKRSSAR